MKYSENWLREWVNPKLNLTELCDKLTMAGLEVEEIIPVAEKFSNVIIGEIVNVAKHREANHLQICKVNIGSSRTLSIVCGASNAASGLKVPVALPNAILPNNKIEAIQIRGVESEGMLCSGNELGLGDTFQELFILPKDAPVGEDLRVYLSLDDFIIDISITPNRGDCLSIAGIAREISALTGSKLKFPTIPEIKPLIKDVLNVKLEASDACPRYVGRIIKNVKADAATPIWMQERLRRAGIRRISPIVDVTNYVMLELGQPMHAFDLDKIKNEVKIRYAKDDEEITLLDGSKQILNEETLVIADSKKPIAIAGVMGGLDSSVTLITQDIFLESAYFSPEVVAQSRQRYNLSSDSAYRFERGVDTGIQRKALERATDLILKIAGGEVGPVIEEVSINLPGQKNILLTSKKITKTLGVTIPDAQVEKIWSSLQFPWEKTNDGWKIEVPSYRHDINLQEDLIEELARLYGYENIPIHSLKANLTPNSRDIFFENVTLLRQGLNQIIK